MSYKQNIMRTLYTDETRYNGAKTSNSGAKTSNRGAKDCSSAAILKLSSEVKWVGSSDHKAHRRIFRVSALTFVPALPEKHEKHRQSMVLHPAEGLPSLQMS